MSRITIPQSVRDYMHRRAIRTAVDHLLDSGSATLPEGLDDWTDVRAYHRAHLSACQVRGEHALLLMDMWNAVWGRTMDEQRGLWKPLSPSQQAEDANPPPASPDDLWADGSPFVRTFESKDGSEMLFLGLSYWADGGIRLHVSNFDNEAEVSPSDEADLSTSWLSDPDEVGYRVTVDGVCVPKDDEFVDLSDLQKLAAAALTALSA